MLFSERPWLFTILFGTITLRAVLDIREGRKSLLPRVLPLIFLLWANTHIQFVYGLALLGLACVAPVIDRRLRGGDEGSPAAFGSPGWRRLLVLTGACLCATLINPYFWHLYGVVFEYATQPGPFLFVNELKALEFREPCDWFMLGLAGAATFALGRRQRLRSFDVLLLIGCAVLAFRARRDLWLLVLASSAILSAGPFSAPQDESSMAWTLRMRLAFVSILAVVVVGLGCIRGLSPSRLEDRAEEVFPAAATRYIAEQGYSGPLYNDFNWGGFLIHALPGLPVAIDGRTNLHGDERLVRYGATWAGASDWQGDPDLAAAGVVVADAQTPLASLLRSDDRFRLVYEDRIARVFVSKRQIKP
jgi:hypothetical protein